MAGGGYDGGTINITVVVILLETSVVLKQEVIMQVTMEAELQVAGAVSMQ